MAEKFKLKTGLEPKTNPAIPGTASSSTIPWAGGVPYGQQATDINQFMTNEAIKPFMANLPGYANMVGQRSQNTQSMLQGQLPQDVVNQISQQSAERGVAGGQGGGPNTNAAFLRALGLNSLDLQQQGSQQLTQQIADTPVPEIWNPASLFMPTVLGQQEHEAAIAGQNNAASLAASSGSPTSWNISSGSSGLPWWWGRPGGL